MSEHGASTERPVAGQNTPAQSNAISESLRDSNIRRRRGDRMIVASGEFQHAVDLAAGLARGTDSVVIAGPSGSGRRHIARAFHGWSPQSAGPLVEVAVDGLPEDQQRVALFGDSKAAGGCAEAASGTLLILNADQLGAGVRNRLAEVLRSRQYTAEGMAEPNPLRARILATATSAEADVLHGAGMKCIAVSGLDQRKEDILPLAAHFLAEFASEEGLDPVGFTSDATEALSHTQWTGNVRELRSRIRQAVRLAGSGAISVEALMLASEGDDILSFKEAKRAFETRYVEGLLRRCSGNISRAARLAKKDRKDFYDVIRRTGVEPGQFRS
jgi:two-component system, NtrC family, response regulator GlrR